MFSQPAPYAEASAAPLFTVPQPPVHAAAAPAPVRFEHTPTGEQAAILDDAATGNPLVIEAGAGTGKTSTLKMVAAAQPGRRGLYLAYNKAIALDAASSFPANVQCSTAHSLAFRQVGHQFKHRLNGTRLPAREVARFLKIPAVLDLGAHALTSVKVARLVMDAVKRFCYSDFDEPARWHIPVVPGLEEATVHAALCDQLVPILYRAWEDLQSLRGRLRFEHDHYLKLWALGRPVLPADLIFLDEAQDANPVIAQIVGYQPAQRILVGDQSQAIYGWRGAVDAMQEFEGKRFQLSQSFRFGQQIADEANRWLELLQAPLRLTGNPVKDSRLDMVPHPGAVLCRTNAGAIGQAMAAIGAGLKPALVGGGDDIRRLARACQDLRGGRGTEHPELMAFRSWAEVQEYAEHDAGGADLKTLVKLVDSHGPEAILRIVDQLVDEHNADVVISTAHRAKGREWETVRLAADWSEPYDQAGKLDRGEAMLTYVAVTRAQDVLDRRSLGAAEHGVGFKVLVEDEERAALDEPDRTPAWEKPVIHSGGRAEGDIPRTVLGPERGVVDGAGSAAMDITRLSDFNDALTPDPEPIASDLPADLVGWLRYARDAADHEKGWKAAKEAAIQKLKDWAVEHGVDEPTVKGRPAFSYKESAPGGQLDGAALKKDHPEIYAKYYAFKKPSRPFNFTGEWK